MGNNVVEKAIEKWMKNQVGVLGENMGHKSSRISDRNNGEKKG